MWPKEWADRYAGQFDDGWDAYRERVLARQKELGVMPADAELSRHDPDVPDWDSLPPEARRLAARMMEVYAGFLSHTDHHIGRLLDFLKETGEFDNTLIMVVSDNGASAEGGPTGTTNELQFFNNAPETLEESLAKIDELGGPTTFNHYPWGWTWAGNTPFRRWKRETYRGGTSDPFLVHWPAGIRARGEIRTQYAHIIDMVPTVLDALDLEPPAAVRGVTQSPIHGVSFAHTFDAPAAPTRHRTQYFEMFGHRAIDHDGWRAVCPWPGPSFAEAGQAVRRRDHRRDADRPGRPPLGALPRRRRPRREPQPGRAAPGQAHRADRDVVHRGREVQRVPPRRQRGGAAASWNARKWPNRATRYVYRPGTQTLPSWSARGCCNRPHAITADAEIPAAGAEGVLLCQGSSAGGWSFYVKDSKLCYAHNYVARATYQVSRAGRASRRQAPAAVRVRAHRRAGHDAGQGLPRPGAAVRRRPARRPRASSRSPRPSPSTPAGSPAAPTQAPRSPPTTRPRSRSPARSTPSPSTSPVT